MQRRRELMQQNNVLDTSPVILAYDTCYQYGNPQKNPPIVSVDNQCITGIYQYTSNQSAKQTIVTRYAYGYAPVYTSGSYKDYWMLQSNIREEERNVVNIGSNEMAFTLLQTNLIDCYAYILETGEILFAGKNTIYYGHRNISELN